MGRVIAIDGPSGAGKSTISRLLAERLGFEFLDTGALYRAVGVYLNRLGFDEKSADEEIKSILDTISVIFKEGHVYLKKKSGLYNGEDLSEAIRTTEAGHYASVFSAKKAVRDFLLHLQRESAEESDIVAEGRDMTTVVFPGAWKKFYLDASEEGRAMRRYLQLKEQCIETTIEVALNDVKVRDNRDMNREIAPLIKAEDAVIIDTTNLSIDEVLERMLAFIRG